MGASLLGISPRMASSAFIVSEIVIKVYNVLLDCVLIRLYRFLAEIRGLFLR